jgi:poly-beta-hydroxyalkanoate depolymerase
MASYDRLFPAQDVLPAGGFGNLIAAPLQGRFRRSGTTVFLDLATMEPHDDQWSYLSTVDRIFKKREIAQNSFVVAGTRVDLGKITDVAVKTVEGTNDDISAPGQCVAALKLLTGLPDSKKASHLEEGAGHYGIFAGKSWRLNIRPLVLNFIDANSAAPRAKDKPRIVAAV